MTERLSLRRPLIALAVYAPLFLGSAQADPTPIPRIGVLVRLTSSPIEEGIRDGLRELGYTEGKNIAIEWRRSAGGNEERLLAADLARSKVDVLVTINTGAGRAALESSTTVPVVFISGDPVGTGLAASLAKPGRNGTGVSVVSTELFPKRLEYLHWLAPRARRIAFLLNSSNPIAAPTREATEKAALTLGVELIILSVRNEAELGVTLRELRRGAADGVIVAGDPFFFSSRSKIVRAIRESKRPAVLPYPHDCDRSVLMCYGPNMREVGRRLAVYVDRILKGANPADLRIEQINKYELIIDLNVARELKLDVPNDLLLRADEVIR